MLEQFTREQFTTQTKFTSGTTYYHKVHTHNHARRGYGILSIPYNDVTVYMRVITRNGIIRVTPLHNTVSNAVLHLTLLNVAIISTRVTTPTIRELSKIRARIIEQLQRNTTLVDSAYRAYTLFCSGCYARYGMQFCYCTDCIACMPFTRYADYEDMHTVDYHIEKHRARYSYCDVCNYCSEHCFGYHTSEDYSDYE
jgi:hypothetical protein